jgi:pSer/pThr/pTyr-binding forkhead associated (FHA) protein
VATPVAGYTESSTVGQDDQPDSPTKPPASAPRVWLRFGEHDVEVAQGESIIGRSPKCQIVLDDALVSRTHARLVLNRGIAMIEDMGSANGVLLNGEKLTRATILKTGDRVAIGQQSFQIFMQAAAATSEPRKEKRFAARTLSGIEADRMMESERGEATRKGDAFDLLVGVTEKVLALGRGDEAERILSSYLRNLLQVARTRGEIDVTVAEKAATFAVRIAEATGKGAWVDYAFELYGVVKRPLPAPVVERLYESLRKLSPVSVSVYRQYLAVLRSVESGFGPADRFLLRRVEGFESLGVLK